MESQLIDKLINWLIERQSFTRECTGLQGCHSACQSPKAPKVKPYSSSYWSNTMKVLYRSWQEEFWRKHFSCGSLKYQALDKRGWLAGGRHHQLVFDGKMPLWAWCAQLPADIWPRNLDSNLSSDTECPLGEPLSSPRSSSHCGEAIDLTSSVGHSWPLHNKFCCGAHRCSAQSQSKGHSL